MLWIWIKLSTACDYSSAMRSIVDITRQAWGRYIAVNLKFKVPSFPSEGTAPWCKFISYNVMHVCYYGSCTWCASLINQLWLQITTQPWKCFHTLTVCAGKTSGKSWEWTKDMHSTTCSNYKRGGGKAFLLSKDAYSSSQLLHPSHPHTCHGRASSTYMHTVWSQPRWSGSPRNQEEITKLSILLLVGK